MPTRAGSEESGASDEDVQKAARVNPTPAREAAPSDDQAATSKKAAKAAASRPRKKRPPPKESGPPAPVGRYLDLSVGGQAFSRSLTYHQQVTPTLREYQPRLLGDAVLALQYYPGAQFADGIRHQHRARGERRAVVRSEVDDAAAERGQLHDADPRLQRRRARAPAAGVTDAVHQRRLRRPRVQDDGREPREPGAARHRLQVRARGRRCAGAAGERRVGGGQRGISLRAVAGRHQDHVLPPPERRRRRGEALRRLRADQHDRSARRVRLPALLLHVPLDQQRHVHRRRRDRPDVRRLAVAGDHAGRLRSRVRRSSSSLRPSPSERRDAADAQEVEAAEDGRRAAGE